MGELVGWITKLDGVAGMEWQGTQLVKDINLVADRSTIDDL